MTKEIKKDDISIRYTIDDDGEISTFTLHLDEIEEGRLFSILHDTERYTCIAKVVKRELIQKDI